MDLTLIGSAGWEETSGASLSADESGSLSIERNYRGPKNTLDAFLATIPEGEPDSAYVDLKRKRSYKASLGDSYGSVTLTFSGQQFAGSSTTPVKVSKSRTTRTANIKNETADGDAIETSAGDQSATLTLKYGTALHSVEYVTANDSDTPSMENAADFPGDLNNVIRLLDASPAVTLTPTEYLGGGFQAPDGLDPKIAEADYKVVKACINFTRETDGQFWKCREDWVALIEDETAP